MIFNTISFQIIHIGTFKCKILLQPKSLSKLLLIPFTVHFPIKLMQLLTLLNPVGYDKYLHDLYK